MNVSCDALFHLSNTFCIVCKLTNDRFWLLSPILSNLVMSKVSKNLFRAKVALNIGLPSSLFHTLWTGSALYFFMPMSQRGAVSFQFFSIYCCYHLSLSFEFLSISAIKPFSWSNESRKKNQWKRKCFVIHNTTNILYWHTVFPHYVMDAKSLFQLT